MQKETEQEISITVFRFQEIFNSEVAADKVRFQNESDYFRVYRALKETMRSRELENMQLAKVDIYSIAYFLLDNEKTAYAFADWINTRAFDWENHWLPRNANRLYAVGKKEILRRKGVRR